MGRPTVRRLAAAPLSYPPTAYSRRRLQYSFDRAYHLAAGDAYSVWLGVEVLHGLHAAHVVDGRIARAPCVLYLPPRRMTALAQATLATLLVSLISLVGVFVVHWSDRVEERLLGFAAGVLLATAFLDLLPEAVQQSGGRDDVFAAALGAMILFFVIERLVHAFHMHEESHAHASRYLILIGDGLHNLIDGVVIAASFLVSPELGVTTTVAVAAHEIPQEIADYGLLVSGRIPRRTALLLNFATGLTALVGVGLCFAFRDAVEARMGWALTATAGMFIYIAASDLIPELHHLRSRGSHAHTLPFFGGIGFVALLAVVSGH